MISSDLNLRTVKHGAKIKGKSEEILNFSLLWNPIFKKIIFFEIIDY
jgi:hypothetical protein